MRQRTPADMNAAARRRGGAAVRRCGGAAVRRCQRTERAGALSIPCATAPAVDARHLVAVSAPRPALGGRTPARDTWRGRRARQDQPQTPTRRQPGYVCTLSGGSRLYA